jgi:amidase
VMGNPVVALPCGFDESGTPFGIQVVGKPYQDRFVLGVAHALEQIFNSNSTLKRPLPDIRKLKS